MKRSTMRPWILVRLCCLGALGAGACSARPLLDITLTATPGLSTMGYPRIDVTRTDGKTLVKEVDKTDGGDRTALLVIDGVKPTYLGVYLPSGTEGPVKVSAAIVAPGGACDLTCLPQTVTVHGGDVTSVALTVMRSSGDCAAARPDGGADAADDVRADANPSDGAADRDADIATAGDCIAYCSLYGTLCPNNADSNLENCVGFCMAARWPVGSPDDLTGQNTLSCRKRHLGVGANPTLDCSECSAGSPASPGVCGSPVDAGARDACPLYE
ncbi:MAG TPA: hypothetical protein VLA14_02120 [Polyangia bacterium]|jgi:hypothetical protein|nr:hypothetical protein [Polyangia bacterium]